MRIGSLAVMIMIMAVDLAAASDGLPFPIGVARIDITPEEPIRLSGYLVRTTETRAVQQKLWAKALAIGSDRDGASVLVSVDNLGVSAAIVDEVAARLKRSTGLAHERLTVASSHTHTAPCLTGVAPNIFGKPIPVEQQARIDRYTRDLTDRLERVIRDALAARRPGRLAWSQGNVAFASNRRTPGGPVEHSMPVLKATGEDGSLRAIVVNYACHCTTLDPKDNAISGDWAGYAQAAIEADHPGCIAMTVIGCGADANPLRRPGTHVAAAHGRSIADEVTRLLHGPWIELPTLPEIALERFRLPFDTLPNREQLERLVKAGGPPGYNASVQLARLDRGEPLPHDLPYSAQTWKFGDKLLMVFLPGEVVVDYVLRLKTELDPGRLWVTAYANDLPCYIPSERILREGGYEGGGAMVYYGRPTRLKPGVEQLIVGAVHRLAGPDFARPAAKVADDAMPRPLPPDEAVRSFRVKPGLTLELVAAEPLIESPVAIDFGADGRLWVCEMRDYPSGIDGNGKPGGVIKVLEDRDGDGRYDRATPFLEGLAFPTGVMVWRKGALICAAPEIIYAEDTNGDGKADFKRTLFRGFATENFQARVNGLSYGIDNWVYGANGLIGGMIHGMASGREYNIGGRDFRFKPDTGEFEPASGLTQQGRVHDDWGNQFGGNNSVLIQHYPLPDHYARRNPRVAAPGPSVALAGDADPSQLFPASRTLARYNHPESANHVTSACSPLIYRDDLLGAGYAGNAFVCEPVHNLVTRLIVEPRGVTFSGHRAADETKSEFLASTDSWCRPVQVRTGPDGALWVVDMYRFVIEHPRWISPELLTTLDVRAGADRGRIYRLFPANRPPRRVRRIDTLATPDLAAALDQPNGTVRDSVHRLIAERADRAAIPALSKLALTASRPEVRAQALAALDGLGGLESSLLVHALHDPHPGVRQQALRASEPWLAKDSKIGDAALALVGDPDLRVRYQLALSLGEWSGAAAGQALGKIAVNDQADIWMRGAILSSSVPHAASILEQVVNAAGPGGPPLAMIEPLIATLAASGDHRSIAQALAVIRGNPGKEQPQGDRWRIGAAAELLDSSRDQALVGEPAVKALIGLARETAGDRSASGATRLAALRLLGRVPTDRAVDREIIGRQLDPTEPVDVQLAAIQALTRMDDEPSSAVLVTCWPKLGPAIRAAALDAMLARAGATEVLLAALERHRIEPAAVDAAHREQLISRGAAVHRQRAMAIFGTKSIGPRQAVLKAFASVKNLHGDPEQGKKAFARVCAACHQVAGIGHDVGPDLTALTDLSADALLTAVLDPNHEVDARYISYTAALKDGRVLSGLIGAETASAITLKRQEGHTDTILRSDLEEMIASGKSLMPEGLENDLKPAELADVIAFLARSPARPKELPGNRPQTVAQAPDGSIHLAASTAAIYGPSLTFEPEFRNLGYWNDARDHATWTFHVDQPATFTVSINWACADDAAGNAFRIRVDDTIVHRVTGSTGSWSTYRSLFLTEVHLKPGEHRLDMAPEGPVRIALADVRFIKLTPSTGGRRTGQSPKQNATDLARQLLDATRPEPERRAIIDQHPELATDLIAAMADGLGTDRAEEYRRIPWIWRVALSVGRRNRTEELHRLLGIVVPQANSPLADWQAVVIGGGLINGITQSGAWPGRQIEAILRDDPGLSQRWQRVLELASTMADNPAVSTGTRYDALRLLGVDSWDHRGAQLVKYLGKGVDAELQQGAVSALGDMPAPQATHALISGLTRFTPQNRKLAIEALTRDDDRRNALLDSMEAGQVTAGELGDEIRIKLSDPSTNRSFERARKLLAK